MAEYFDELYAPKNVIGTAADDRLYGGKGADQVDGGEGDDTFVVGANFGDCVVSRDGQTTTVGAAPYADSLVNVESIQFADLLIRLDDPVLLQPVQHAWGAGADTLIGNDWGYSLKGGEGDDVFFGNGGDDSLYGGKGNDTAVYRGNRADYVIQYDLANRQIVVHDLVAGRDGNDRVFDIETLRFADMQIALAPLPSAPAPSQADSGFNFDAPAGTVAHVLYLAPMGLVTTVGVGTNTPLLATAVAVSATGIDTELDTASQAAHDAAAGSSATHAVDVDLIGLPELWALRDWYAHVTHCQY